jgi:hypothetical protein
VMAQSTTAARATRSSACRRDRGREGRSPKADAFEIGTMVPICLPRTLADLTRQLRPSSAIGARCCAGRVIGRYRRCGPRENELWLWAFPLALATGLCYMRDAQSRRFLLKRL